MTAGRPDKQLIYRLSDFFQGRFAKKVYRVTVDGGFSCPNRSCAVPSPCVFCDERGSAARHINPADDIRVQYEAGKARIRERFKADAFIPYFQSYTNTYDTTETCLARYAQVLDDDAPGIAIGTRPDCLADDLIEALGRLSMDRLVMLDLGVQSMTDHVLTTIRRGHDAAAVHDALSRLSRWPEIHVCIHLIFGLPGETEDEMMQSRSLFRDYPVKGLKIHQLNILEGTVLAGWYREGKVVPLALTDYVRLAADFLEQVPADVVIHRLSARADDHSVLLAPEWGQARLMPMQRILDELKRRGSFQGKFFGQHTDGEGNSP